MVSQEAVIVKKSKCTYRLLAVQLQVLFRFHKIFLRLIGVGRVNPFRDVCEDFLSPKHAVGVEARIVRCIAVVSVSDDKKKDRQLRHEGGENQSCTYTSGFTTGGSRSSYGFNVKAILIGSLKGTWFCSSY